MTITSIGPVQKDLGDGHFMVTSLDFDDVANKMNVYPDLTTTNKVSGFHGQVRPVHALPTMAGDLIGRWPACRDCRVPADATHLSSHREDELAR